MNRWILGGVAAMVVFGACVSQASEPAAKAEVSTHAVVLQTECPIMGGKIVKDVFVDFEGKRIYLCCKGCIAPVQKDPAAVIKKMEDAGITLYQTQTECPVMGGKIDKDVFVDFEGKRIYLCCKGCIAPVQKDPAAVIKKMEDAGIILDETPKEEKK